jgi:hypothetical protein
MLSVLFAKRSPARSIPGIWGSSKTSRPGPTSRLSFVEWRCCFRALAATTESYAGRVGTGMSDKVLADRTSGAARNRRRWLRSKQQPRLLRRAHGKASYGNVALSCGLGNHAGTYRLRGGGRSPLKPVSADQIPC